MKFPWSPRERIEREPLAEVIDERRQYCNARKRKTRRKEMSRGYSPAGKRNGAEYFFAIQKRLFGNALYPPQLFCQFS